MGKPGFIREDKDSTITEADVEGGSNDATWRTGIYRWSKRRNGHGLSGVITRRESFAMASE